MSFLNRVLLTIGLLSVGYILTNESIKQTKVASASDGVVVAAAGDVACDPRSSSYNQGNGTENKCHMKATADLILNGNFQAVLALGDLQYEDGNLEAFKESYDGSWGKFKSITYPAVGNHEYGTEGAWGYFLYFGKAAGDPKKGYYSYDLGDWHIIVLNSNCSYVGGCQVGSEQEKWLKQDLAANQKSCTLAYWHHPRFSSGPHGNNDSYDAFWQHLYDAGVEIVLTAHDHNYERFAPQNPQGEVDNEKGIRQFVVGTGGKSLYNFGKIQPNSEVRNSDTYGILKLTLQAKGYSWEFVPETGKTFTDTGKEDCH